MRVRRLCGPSGGSPTRQGTTVGSAHITTTSAMPTLACSLSCRIRLVSSITMRATPMPRRHARKLQACLSRRAGGSHPVAGCLTFSSAWPGTIQPSVLVASANPVNPADVCERHYYAGEASLLHGEIADACTYFHGSLATDLALQPGTISGDPMNEWHLARWRLDQLDDPAKSIACPGGS